MSLSLDGEVAYLEGLCKICVHELGEWRCIAYIKPVDESVSTLPHLLASYLISKRRDGCVNSGPNSPRSACS